MKSQSVSDLLLLKTILIDTYASRQDSTSLARDMAYLAKRVAREGQAFLTKTLPLLGEALLKGLETSVFVCPTGFRRRKRGRLPQIFCRLFLEVFDHDGQLLASPDPYSVQEILQASVLFKKQECEFSNAHLARLERDFCGVEDELSRLVLPADERSQSILDHAQHLISRVLNGFNPKDIIPKHGPGSVATGESGNGKYVFKRKYQRLHQMYPYYEYFSPSLGRVSFESGWYQKLSQDLNACAKVVYVPKDSRGPRLISMEPLEIQWIQQGLMRKLVPHIERHPLTRGYVNFTDQGVNQELAFVNSITREYATLDLKEASDRISLQLFRRLFPKEIADHFEACRSVMTKFPSGNVVALTKFAPMGSALCFPVLALTVWALTKSLLRHEPAVSGNVYVYGDDLVVPTDAHAVVSDFFPSVGLRVNDGKSFSRGFFRESCGMDAYRGVAVTPIRIRKNVGDQSDRSANYFAHFLSLSESFFNKGYWRTTGFIREMLSRRFGALHWTSRDQDGIYCPDPSVCLERNRSATKSRWNVDLQRWECKVRRRVSPRVSSEILGHGRLLKGVVNPTGRWMYHLNGEDGNHGTVTPRHRGYRKMAWTEV